MVKSRNIRTQFKYTIQKKVLHQNTHYSNTLSKVSQDISVTIKNQNKNEKSSVYFTFNANSLYHQYFSYIHDLSLLCRSK